MSAALLPLVLSLLLGADAPAAPGAPSLQCDADTLRADADGLWSVPLVVHNPMEYGLYGDSMVVAVTDLDRGTSRRPRVAVQTLRTIPGGTDGISGGSQARALLSLAATSERARLVFRVAAHDGQKHRYALVDSVLADGGELSARYPSRYLSAGGRRIEVVSAGPAPSGGSRPGLLLVPGEDGHARTLLRLIDQFVQQGWNVVAVSPPGYGLSEGAADLAGPATLAALEAALAELLRMPAADGKRVAVWGSGRGATAALLLAERHAELRGAVAQDALYDLWSAWRAAGTELRADIESEAGRDSAAWRARSPLAAAVRGKVPLLLVQSGPAAEARAYAAARAAGGVAADTLFAASAPRQGHRNAARVAQDFLIRLTTP